MLSSERLAAAVEAAQSGEPVEEAARRYEVPAADVERMLRAMDDGLDRLWQAIMGSDPASS